MAAWVFGALPTGFERRGVRDRPRPAIVLQAAPTQIGCENLAVYRPTGRKLLVQDFTGLRLQPFEVPRGRENGARRLQGFVILRRICSPENE